MTFALFALLAVVTLGGAVGVALEPRMARMPVWMLGVLLGVAGLFALLRADALAIVQVLVSAGGTLAILTYGILMTAPGPQGQPRPSWPSVVAAGVAVVLLAFVLIPALTRTPTPGMTEPLPGMVALGGAILDFDSGTQERPLANLPEGSCLARPPATYLLPGVVVALQLLIVLTGAAYLARGRGQEAQP